MNLSFDHRNPKHLLALTGVLFILAVIPITAYLVTRSEENAKNPKAATTLTNTVDQLIADRGDHHLAHEIQLAEPMYSSYDWGNSPVENNKTLHSGMALINSWIVAFRSYDQQTTTPNIRVNIRNMRTYIYHANTNQWVQTFNGLPTWMASSNADTSGDYQDITPTVESDGSYSFNFPINRALHMGQSTPGFSLSAYDAVVSVVEGRLIGNATDIANAKWGMASGADTRAANNDAGTINQVGWGHLGLLTADWKAFDMLTSVLTDSQIRANPPPSFTTTTSTADTTPPTVSVSSPANGAAALAGTITFSANASDNSGGSGLASVVFSIDGGSVKTITAPGPYSFSLDTKTLTNASHKFRATATDVAGYSAYSEVTATVNNPVVSVPPVISALSSVPADSTATINWTTDQAASTQLTYGTTTSYGTSPTPSALLTTAHSVGMNNLSANTTYYFKVTSTNSASLSTSATGSFTTKPPVITSNFNINYFNNMTLSGTAVTSATKTGSTLNFNWGDKSPASGVNADKWSASYLGTFTFDAARYRFNATADDGVRVFVDGTKIVDGWKDQAATTYNGVKVMTAGTHTVRVEYYQNLYNDSLLANWVHADSCYDLTGDNVVNRDDLNVFANHFNERGAQTAPWDFDGDKLVSSVDLGLMAKQYGQSCS